MSQDLRTEVSKLPIPNPDPPEGFVRCPACSGSGESEHWTTCYLCNQYAERDPRYYSADLSNATRNWMYCRKEEAVRYVQEQRGYWERIWESLC